MASGPSFHLATCSASGAPAPGRAGLRRPRRYRSAFLPLLALLAGCELEEVVLTEPENVLVAEIYLKVGDGPDEGSAYLHWTLGTSGAPDLSGSSIRLEGPDGGLIPLVPADPDVCLSPETVGAVQGACFRAPAQAVEVLRPGDRLEVEVTAPGGSVVRGGVVLPGDLVLLEPGLREACALPPGTPLELVWSRSEGAWAYAGETLIWGLRDALAPEGIELDRDTVSLLGLSVSESDTTLVFPMEFGVFDRFDLDRDLALALQEGLPPGAEAEVVISALERNYVNWVRGGNFNPSGAVRIPSLRGDGIGVLGGIVRRTIRVVGGIPGNGLPSCLPGG